MVFAPGEMGFHRAERPARHDGNLRVGESLLIAKMQGGLFVAVEPAEGGGQILAQRDHAGRRRRILIRQVGRGRLRRGTGLAAAGIAKMIVGDAEQPGQKPGVAAVERETAIGLQESFLREVVGEGVVAAGELSQKTPDGGLVAQDQFAESRAVIVAERPRDQFWIGRDHARLEGGWSRGSDGLPDFMNENSPKSRFATPMKAGIAAYGLAWSGSAR